MLHCHKHSNIINPLVNFRLSVNLTAEIGLNYTSGRHTISLTFHDYCFISLLQAIKIFGKGTRTIAVAGSPNSRWNHWTVTFVDDPIPSTHTFSDVGTAYFVVPTCPANLHHFWSDQFLALWSVMRRTGRLQQQLQPDNNTGSNCRQLNTIVYRLPYHQIASTETSCYSVARSD